MKILITFDDYSIAEIEENMDQTTFDLSSGRDRFNHIQSNDRHIGSFRSFPENYMRTLKNFCALISNEAEFVINNRKFKE